MGEVVKCPRLSTRGGEGVKNSQNLVHVVVECPLITSFKGVAHSNRRQRKQHEKNKQTKLKINKNVEEIKFKGRGLILMIATPSATTSSSWLRG